MTSLLRGEDLNIGVGVENPSARGTNVAPQAYIPGRTPSGINVEVVKSLLKETKASGINSQGSVVVQRRASGDLEFNVKSETIGYILKSLLGSVSSVVVSGSVKDHTFEVLSNNPQFPTLTLALSQPSHQDYDYPGCLVRSLNLNIPVDDLVNATVEFIALDEEESVASPYSPSFGSTDYYFRPQDVEVKIAANIAGLAAAEAINVKELSLNIQNNARPQQHIGSIIPTDNIANLIEITGNIVLDYADDTYHDYFKNGTSKAMQIKLTRSDVDLTGGYPTITIQLANITLESSSPDRPIDDIVRDSFGFTAHYDATNTEAINVVVRNTVADYDYDA